MIKSYQINAWIFILVIFILSSCGERSVDPKIIGTWNSEKHKITVRTEPKKMKFKFTSDSTFTSLTINSDKTVDGNIGSAVIENGKIKTNWLLPTSMTGVAYTIECDLIGKIFENDPLETKEVEFWVRPFEGNMKYVELRYTQNGARFPMALLVFSKKGD